MKRYEAWFVPTERGVKAFKWEPKKLAGPYDKRDDALMVCWEHRQEEAGDFYLFGNYEVKEVESPQ